MTYLAVRIATCIEITLFRAKIQFTIENHYTTMRSAMHSVKVLINSELHKCIVYCSECGEM